MKELDQVIVVLFTTHMFIGGFFGFVLDNTIPGRTGADHESSSWTRYNDPGSFPPLPPCPLPGTDKERGIRRWKEKDLGDGRTTCDQSCYDIPYCGAILERFRCSRYLPFLPTFKTSKQQKSSKL